MIFIGAGKHSKSVLDIVISRGDRVDGYIDDNDPPFSWKKLTDEDLGMVEAPELALAFVGLTCASLERRYKLMQAYCDKLRHGKRHNQIASFFPLLIHPKAYISSGAFVGSGTQVMASAVINYSAHIGFGCVINSGAIIEHDAHIGDGCHIAPGATVLGGATIGDFCFIGAGAIVIQGAFVPERTFVKAGTVWK